MAVTTIIMIISVRRVRKIPSIDEEVLLLYILLPSRDLMTSKASINALLFKFHLNTAHALVLRE